MQTHHAKGFTLIEIITVIGIFTLLSGIVIANLRDGKNNQILREASQLLVDDMRSMQNKTIIGATLGVCHQYDMEGTDLILSDDTFLSYWEDCNPNSPICADPTPLDTSDRVECKAKFPPGGYGIYFQESRRDQYLKFADFDAVSSRLDNTSGGIPVFYEGEGTSSTDSDLSLIDLPEGVEVAGISFTPQFDEDTGLETNPKGNLNCYHATDGSKSVFANADEVSLAWLPPSGALYAIFHKDYVDNTKGICPDYIINVMLKHTKTEKCRTIIVNASSGLIDEKSDPSCTLP